ncbi:MAG: mannose-1-phosphate guanylyltransferase/mannose-6-phosphate isomerase [Pseudomonadota bacterium]
MIVPVILSGGSGSRLWPLSRKCRPKQFLSLNGQRSMLQDTLERLDGLDGVADPIVVCNSDHRFVVAEQLRELGKENATIILEPVGRNTAPAITAAALVERARPSPTGESDPLLLVLPADHVFTNPQQLRQAITEAVEPAREGQLVTFGIVPKSPETGYGYIRVQSPTRASASIAKVDQFVEKPDRATAEAYLTDGRYFWNSGMFMFGVDSFLEEIKRCAPDVLQAVTKACGTALEDLDFLRLDADAFASCESISVDYAIMEKTTRATVVSLDAGWNDIGSWSALHDVQTSDEQNNVRVGDTLLYKVENSYVHATARLVSLVGVSDLVVVETADAVLVTTHEASQEVKRVVDKLTAKGRSEATEHRKMYRPWGSYDSIDTGDRFQVKRITVNPGETLSLQMHHHRAEHWIVVSGTAEVTSGNETFLLTENQSTYIPLGTTHRLANPGKVPLHLIEVQSGSYLGEDDIVRFEDNYGR